MSERHHPHDPTHHHGAGPATADGRRVLDPVCGMKVDPATTPHRAEHGGRDFFFCSAGCKTKFEAGPDGYLAVDAKAGTVTIHHSPISALGWPAMTMTFKATPEALRGAKAGQTVSFTLKTPENQVVAIQPK